MRWTEHVACVGERRDAYRVVVGKPKQVSTQNFSFALGAWGWGWGGGKLTLRLYIKFVWFKNHVIKIVS